MDFHTLSRKDLQALCKKNKIPANITNVAMAEALQSLQMVEGLEEVLAHPATETPARSVTASNRQRAVKEEAVTSKVTRTNRGTRKAGEETAAPSASLKVPMAQSTLKNDNSTTVQQACSTRRSTRILEKQLCQLSLKENDDMLDAKADLQKDSQDMQRQFSADMENSLDLNDETSDETDVSKETTEEPIIVEAPVQHMDTVLEDELPTSERSKQLENAAHRVEEANLVHIPIQNMDQVSSQFEPFMKLESDAGELEKSSNQKECKDDEVQPMQEDAVDLDVTQNNVNDVYSAQHTLSEPMTEPESDNEFFVESDTKAIENATVTVTVTDQEGADQLGVDNAPNAVTMDEHVFGSEDTAAVTEEIGSSNISRHTVTQGDDVEAVSEVEQRNDLETRSTEISDDEFDFLSESESESESSESQSEEVETTAEEVNEMRTNQSSCKKSDDKQEKFALQDENMSFLGTATPIEKKSLRQLKKMVKEKKQALGLRQENV